MEKDSPINPTNLRSSAVRFFLRIAITNDPRTSLPRPLSRLLPRRVHALRDEPVSQPEIR